MPDPNRIPPEEKSFPFQIKQRAYFSTYHLCAARQFAQCAQESEAAEGRSMRFDIKQTSYVAGSIIASAAFLEAAINEFLKDIADGQSPKCIDPECGKLIKAYWDRKESGNRSSVSILNKYQDALELCRKPRFKTGEQPYQDAKLGIELRNELTHYKPEFFGGDDQHRFTEKLRGKFAENPLMVGSGNPYFPDKFLGSPCALWVVTSVQTLADAFFGSVGVMPNYQVVKF